MAIKAKAILPVRFNFRALNQALEGLMETVLDGAEADHKRTVQSWAQKPVFARRVRRSFTHILGEVTTDDRIYRFIDRGTTRGYAEFTKDWTPKTKPNVIGSFAGSGRRRRVNFFRPKPGVTPRNFTLIIGEKAQAQFNRLKDKTMREAAKESNHWFR